MKNLNQNGLRFAAAMRAVSSQAKNEEPNGQKVHVIGAGRTLTSAYEQLRNAAEYTEDHLLLQRAIRRFYKRLFLAPNESDIAASGEELVTELTLAGYLPNDSVSKDTAQELAKHAANYYHAYRELDKQAGGRLDAWTLDVLAVAAESELSSHAIRDVFAQFAFERFVEGIDTDSYFDGKPADYELSLYAAIHRKLLKSDDATIRWALLERFQQSPSQSAPYMVTNQKIDEILNAKTTDKLGRIVASHGASLRILWRFMNDHENAGDLLENRSKFLAAYEAQVAVEYEQINSRINRGILKSVVFLIITKFLIGIAIEVPYDYWRHGGILWTALIVNLFLPPVYMILLRFTLNLPKPGNTVSLVDHVDQLLYGEEPRTNSIRMRQKQYSAAFNVVYALLFITAFGLVSWGLVSIGFSIVHLLIFFVFFSTASFLGFRLSRMIREVEVIDSEQSGIAMVRDFFYLPFVAVGRKLSEEYSKFNVVAMVLDMLIELPLKTLLRLVRQWGAFISSKKDEL